MTTDTVAASAPLSRAKRRKNLTLLTASTAMDNAESSVVTVLFPLMREAMGLTSSALGTIVAVGKVVGMVSGIPWVFLARRYPRKVVLATCSGFWGIWVIAAGFSTSFTQFVILYAIAAAGFAGAGPIALEILGDLYGDSRRGGATGLLYGGVALIAGVSAPLFGLLSHSADGWRYGYLASGTICLLVGLLILILLDDPAPAPDETRPALDAVELKARSVRIGLRELLAISTFRLILVQRLCSGQNVMMSFGVVFLVEERGFSTATASIAALPFAVGYLTGTVLGGRANDHVHRLRPRSGRIIMLQASQLAFAAVAFVTTQVGWSGIAVYAVLFALLGLLQGQVPVVNRPLIMAVVRPELRALAFAVSVTTVEALAYAGYALLVGRLGDTIGLQKALLIITVLLTAANGLASAALYRPYARDSAAVAEPRTGSPKS
ncbi:MFS transporter [Streptomyces durmitorensis]|uniref:MFS transporter n=1 Tax=Streptomyces durmitorensis TaxID=319947 RepID=A0ABY4PLN9_9ACTN|nr:MFS transporter [Streptomyces durmitorensis]UQT54707.1 MFS transporter [Streptomyces durmitorensis]